MLLLTATTTETSEQEQKRNASSSSSSSDTISTTTRVAVTTMPVSQTGSVTSEIDWSVIIQHLSGDNDNQPAQLATTPTLTPVRVPVEVTDPDEDNRELVQCYLQTAARYGVRSQEASQAFTGIAEKFRPYIIKRLLGGGQFSLQKEDAEDIAQEVLTDLWNWLNGYILIGGQEEQKKELGNFAQIIRIIIRNCLVNWLQHQYRARPKKQHSKRVTNSVKFVSLHHVSSSHILTSRIRDFGRELELSSHYSEVVRSYEGSRSGSRDMSALIDQLYATSHCTETIFEQRELLRELAAIIAAMKRFNPHYVIALSEHVRGKSHQQVAVENGWKVDQAKKYLYRARRWLANYFASAATTAVIGNEGENEKESTVTSRSVSRAERERKKVKKSEPSRTEEWQVAAD
jgi:DNA-directed RNA polymerase specialized sigma24 family protein